MKRIDTKDIMHLNFLKMSNYTGSSEGMRYRMEKHTYRVPDTEAAIPEPTAENPEPEPPAKESTDLLVTVWPEPFAYDHTPEDRKISRSFTFDEDGISKSLKWLNEMKQQDWNAKRLRLEEGI
ncbi:hypothetical protein ACTNEN_01790 [Oribacterium sp. HCP28S3_H8]|jgi:hypothetical protein|uniref:hypothetical protein n=1 Tax=Oribacterium sp. HCP28S3_H8 TaxID=3438945 RepID=UPI00305E3CCA|nr:hypothetical protein [Oribacterium sp.]